MSGSDARARALFSSAAGLVLLVLCGCLAAAAQRQHVAAPHLASFAPAPDSGPEQSIRAVLNQQVAAWNRGDLEGYMQGYWRSPELSFYSGANVTQGWDATLTRYRNRYQGTGKEMGKLDFAQLEIH